MSGPRLYRIVRGLSAHLGTETADAATDAQLVERFVLNRDEAAFAALVERHGPVVLGVSRQVLHDAHAAEDVFQATFLLLARKAGTLRTPGGVRGWLYETAVNLARTARAAAARRHDHEQQAASRPRTGPPDSPTPNELRAVLYEEVSRLREKYRLPVLLCHLENVTHDQAAAALGCPVGTIRSRLSRAREMLRRRLERRGVTLAAL